jgi:hypothetical protein
VWKAQLDLLELCGAPGLGRDERRWGIWREQLLRKSAIARRGLDKAQETSLAFGDVEQRSWSGVDLLRALELLERV